MSDNNYNNDVFINCPFDDDFKEIFFAISFTIVDCGFRARCAKEESDSSNVRVDKILRIIEESKYGIHDISRTELCENTQLPRFNMPLELGMFLGAKRYGSKKQREKVCLITDKEPYRYNIYISDINGQDIKSHGNNVDNTINIVSSWLRDSVDGARKKSIAGGSAIAKRYSFFRQDLPDLCCHASLTFDELEFNDYQLFVSEWIAENNV